MTNKHSPPSTKQGGLVAALIGADPHEIIWTSPASPGIAPGSGPSHSADYGNGHDS